MRWAPIAAALTGAHFAHPTDATRARSWRIANGPGGAVHTDLHPSVSRRTRRPRRGREETGQLCFVMTSESFVENARGRESAERLSRDRFEALHEARLWWARALTTHQYTESDDFKPYSLLAAKFAMPGNNLPGTARGARLCVSLSKIPAALSMDS